MIFFLEDKYMFYQMLFLTLSIEKFILNHLCQIWKRNSKLKH